jgi:preprotein translocase subunit SecD
VRGFAFTLGLTTLIDVLIAFVFTRPLVAIILRTRWMASGSRWTGLSKERIGLEPEEPAEERQTLTASRAARTGGKES